MRPWPACSNRCCRIGRWNVNSAPTRPICWPGGTRVEALRRLARRIEVSSVTILVSALVQAEQLGTGIAGALRRQAEDLRDRRRERANAFAMALPVKRMFPLVVCFMPGIFVWTLGPFFVQLFQFADTFIKVRNF